MSSDEIPPKRYLYSVEGLLGLEKSELCSAPDFKYEIDVKQTGSYGQKHSNNNNGGRNRHHNALEGDINLGPPRGTFQSSAYRPKQAHDSTSFNTSSGASMNSYNKRDRGERNGKANGSNSNNGNHSRNYNNHSRADHNAIPDWADASIGAFGSSTSGTRSQSKTTAQSIAEFEEWKASQRNSTAPNTADAGEVGILLASSSTTTVLSSSGPLSGSRGTPAARSSNSLDDKWGSTTSSFFDLHSASQPSLTSPPISSSGGSSRFSRFFKGPASEASASSSKSPSTSTVPIPQPLKQSPPEEKKSDDKEGFARLLNLLEGSAQAQNLQQGHPSPAGQSATAQPIPQPLPQQPFEPHHTHPPHQMAGNDMFFESLLNRNGTGFGSLPGAPPVAGSQVLPPPQGLPFPQYANHNYNPPPFGFPGIPEWTGKPPYDFPTMPPPGMMMPPPPNGHPNVPNKFGKEREAQ